MELEFKDGGLDPLFRKDNNFGGSDTVKQYRRDHFLKSVKIKVPFGSIYSREFSRRTL